MTPEDSRLVERLTAMPKMLHGFPTIEEEEKARLCHEAARRIESLSAERDEAMGWLARTGVLPDAPLATGVAYLHGIYRGASEKAEAAEARVAVLERVIRDLLDGVGGGSDNARCHVGITTREKCAQCRRVDAARAALAAASPPETK